MRTLVLSMETEKGKLRRDLLNYEYEWVKAIDCPEEYKSKFNFIWNTRDSLKTGIMNCFAGHLHIMEKIINEKINDCLVCEDDAFMIWDKEGIDTSHINEICLFSGRLHHPTNWKLDNKWRKEVLPTIVNSFSNGLNKIDYEEYRWGGTAAIYYPTWEKVKELYEKIVNGTGYKHIDIYLANNKLINYLYYPSPLVAIDCLNEKKEIVKSRSQICEGQGIVLNYTMTKDPKIFEEIKHLIF